ncbi:MAG: hypothetical protein IJS99_04430 [Synergistaceae bacterium]|nr:hypothetical protein [Synergistaceae bacterium]
MRIYLDTCCYNRPFDAENSEPVRLEKQAVISILKDAHKNGDIIIGSDIIKMELSGINDILKRNLVSLLYVNVDEEINHNESAKIKANSIRSAANVKYKDSLHITLAEEGKADIFLTTDYRLIKACKNLSLKFRVFNPADFMNLRNGGSL